MAQVTRGIRSILSNSFTYDLVQNALGANSARRRLVEEFIRPVSGDTLLDVGCGTCTILEHMPSGVGYIGMDLSQQYIETAKIRFKGRGHFYCMDVAAESTGVLPPFDIALAVGLLHHLDDHQVIRLFSAIEHRLAPGGRLVTVDPCHHPGQSQLARFLISQDRGRNIRHSDEYANLARKVFSTVQLTVLHDLSRVPYTHAILECKNQ